MRSRDDDTGDQDFIPPGAETTTVECPKGHKIAGWMMKGSDATRQDTHFFPCCECGAERDNFCIYVSKRNGVEVRPVDAAELLAFYLSMRSHVARMKGPMKVVAHLQMQHDLIHFDDHARRLCFDLGLLSKE